MSHNYWWLLVFFVVNAVQAMQETKKPTYSLYDFYCYIAELLAFDNVLRREKIREDVLDSYTNLKDDAVAYANNALRLALEAIKNPIDSDEFKNPVKKICVDMIENLVHIPDGYREDFVQVFHELLEHVPRGPDIKIDAAMREKQSLLLWQSGH